MKVKVTATITLETDLEPEYYDPPKTEDEIIPWELEQIRKFTSKDGVEANAEATEADTTLFDILMMDGDVSDIKIEKIAEESPAKSEAA